MELKDMKNLFVIGFAVCVLITTMAVIHSYESSVYIRCDGKSIFPHTEEDIKNNVVIGGNMKLDNAIAVNLKIQGITLYEPTTQGFTKASFVKNCRYDRVGIWYFR